MNRIILIVFSLLIGMYVELSASNYFPKHAKKYQVSVWHWGSTNDSFGINSVVTDAKKMNTTLASYKKNNITRVYGDYFKMASTNTIELKTWNKKLYKQSIKSIYLLGSPEWIYPEYRKDMLAFIKENYITFNQSVTEQERLQGIHLDIEPHGLAEWQNASKERRREMLFMLKDALNDVRQMLITNNMGTDELMADFPFWFEHFDAIGWYSDTDRVKWFAELGQIIDGISIMNYENSNPNILIERVQWEKENFKGVVELGFDFEEIGKLWKSKTHFSNIVSEISRKTNMPIAIHRYAFVLKASNK